MTDKEFDMQAFLIEQMTKVASGKLVPVQASAIADLAEQVYNLRKLELELLKLAPVSAAA